MILAQLVTAAIKEARLILRDRHALAILFVMPVVFVAILSLALRDAFSERAGVTFSVLIVNHDQGVVGAKLTQAFLDDKHFRVERATAPLPDADQIGALVNAGHYPFALLIPEDATIQARKRAVEQLRTDGARGKTPPVELRLLADPNLRADHRSLVLAFTNGALHAVEAGLIGERIADLARTPFGTSTVSATGLATPHLFHELTDELERSADRKTIPTSVQQNAPAWTLLAMFFLAIPMSVTFIKERSQGSLLRLRSMPVPIWVLFGGKVVPYLVINQLQLLLILAVGVWGLPLLGGDRLVLGDAPGAIALLGVSASLAAIGFGLLIASLARTPEQATTLSATTVLILAALGGIMVPKMVMPPFMQQVAGWSPFSWGLEGFLDIFIRGGGLRAVLPEAGKLLAFATACWITALLLFSQQQRQH